MRKIESSFIGSGCAGSRLPCTFSQAIFPRRATSMTAPGTSPSSICCLVTASSFLSWTDDSPTSSGEAAIGTGVSACAMPIAHMNATSACITTFIDFLPHVPRWERSIDQRGLDHAPELQAQVAGIGVVGLHHVDGVELLLGIDPEGRAAGARPAVFADRAGLGRIADRGAHLEAETEAEARRAPRPAACVVGGHELERLAADDALAL